MELRSRYLRFSEVTGMYGRVEAHEGAQPWHCLSKACQAPLPA
jgi:hypothetical protein